MVQLISHTSGNLEGSRRVKEKLHGVRGNSEGDVQRLASERGLESGFASSNRLLINAGQFEHFRKIALLACSADTLVGIVAFSNRTLRCEYVLGRDQIAAIAASTVCVTVD